MSYKDLLVVLDSDAAARGCIDLAAALAEAFEAHLVALYLVPFPEALRPLGYYDPALLHPLYRELREQARDMADKQHEVFEHVASLHGLSFEWRAVAEGPDADPALHARYADLTILGQLDPEGGPAQTIRPRPEQVALASGRPVIVVPYAGNFATVGRRALIAWNASREATRAVNDAMPLLGAAEEVTVLAIDPREGPDGHGEVPGADISLHLARHGVKATIEAGAAGGRRSHQCPADRDRQRSGRYGSGKRRTAGRDGPPDPA